MWHQDIVADSIQIFFYLCFLGAASNKKPRLEFLFLSITESKLFFRQAVWGQKVFGLQSFYMTAGGSLSLMGSSSLRFPGPFPFAFESPRSAEGRKRYKTTAKTTQTMAIIANPLSPEASPGPGRPSWKN